MKTVESEHIGPKTAKLFDAIWQYTDDKVSAEQCLRILADVMELIKSAEDDA